MQEKQELFSKKYPITSTVDEAGALTYVVFIFTEIGSPSDFSEVISMLDNTIVGDTVIFKLNTPGGRFDTTLSILDAIENSKAQTVAEISGDCASAGTFIALACDGLYISKNSEFMCHNFSGGSGGKGHEIKAHTEFMLPNNTKLIRRVYKSFLTKKEIKQLINGIDFYMGSKEVMERWENVIEHRIKRSNKLQIAHMKEQEMEMIGALEGVGYTITKKED